MALSKKNQPVLVGVDIGSTSIKMLELSMRENKVCVENYAIHPLPEGVVEEKNIIDKDRLAEHLSRLLDKYKKSNVAFSIPTSACSSHIKKIEDLEATDHDLRQYIFAHAESLIPMSLNEASFDFSSRFEEVDGKQRRYLNVVCAKTESIDQRASIFNSIGLVPKIASIESLAVEKILPFISPFPNGGAYFLMDVGYSTTSTYLVRDNKILFNYEYSAGGNFLTQRIMEGEGVEHHKAEELKQQWLAEDHEEFKTNYLQPYFDQIADFAQSGIQVSLSSGEGVYQIAGVVLMGGGGVCAGMRENLASTLAYDVHYAEVVDNLNFAAGVDAEAFRKDQTSMLPALGLALMQYNPAINLLPWREELAQAQRKSYLTNAIISGLLGGVVVLGIWSCYNSQLSDHMNANAKVTAATTQINAELEKLREVTTLRDTMLQRTKLIESLEAQRPTVVMVNNLIVKSVPQEAYLTLYARDGLEYEFRGKAKDPQVVASFMRNLKASPWFDDIFMSSFLAAKNKDGEGNLLQGDGFGEFIVTAKLRGLTMESATGQMADEMQPSNAHSMRKMGAPITQTSAPDGIVRPDQQNAPGAEINKTVQDDAKLNNPEVGSPPVASPPGPAGVPAAGVANTNIPMAPQPSAASGG